MLEEQLAAFASTAFANGEVLVGRFGATVLILTAGITIYSAIVGTFYHYLSRRDLHELKPENRKGISGFVYRFGKIVAFFLKYTVLFPAITFLWFVLLSTFLFLLSRTVELETVFVLSISVVSAVRVLAYYKEEIAIDLAKMLPLALLGVLIVEPTLFSREIVESRIYQLAGALPQFAVFIGFTIALELVLRIIYYPMKLLRGKKEEPTKNISDSPAD
ncbi:MAG: hypothetical protein ABIF01_00170 [Candidatus Micrarchaeota archaeon]